MTDPNGHELRKNDVLFSTKNPTVKADIVDVDDTTIIFQVRGGLAPTVLDSTSMKTSYWR